MTKKNIVESQFDKIISENKKENYVFELNELGRKDKQIITTLKNFKIKGKNCLDIGPGTGRFVRFLREESAKFICAADISDEALKCCEDYVDQSQKLDIENEPLEFHDDFFDVVISFEVLEHLRDPRNYLSEIIRVSKDGGLIMFSMPNITSFISRIRLLIGLLPVAIASDETHVSFYRKKDIRRLFYKFNTEPEFLPTSISLNPFNAKSKFSIPSNKHLTSFDDSLLFFIHVSKLSSNELNV